MKISRIKRIISLIVAVATMFTFTMNVSGNNDALVPVDDSTPQSYSDTDDSPILENCAGLAVGFMSIDANGNILFRGLPTYLVSKGSNFFLYCTESDGYNYVVYGRYHGNEVGNHVDATEYVNLTPVVNGTPCTMGQLYTGESAEIGLSYNTNGITINNIEWSGSNIEISPNGETCTVKALNGESGQVDISATCDITINGFTMYNCVSRTSIMFTYEAEDVSYTFAPSTIEVTVGETAQVKVGRIDNLAVESIKEKESYYVDNAQIATMEYSSSNGSHIFNIAGISEGTTTAYFVNEVGTSIRLPITVKSNKPTDIELSNHSLSLKKNETATLSYVLTPSGVTDNVTWSSSDSSVATVSNGVVTALKSGTTEIIATTSNGCAAACVVTVTTDVESIELAKHNITLDTGKTAQLTYTITPGDADNKAVTWSSSNSNIAKVDSNGMVTALKAGTATVTVKTANGKTDKATIIVTDALPTSIRISPTSKTLTVGESFTIFKEISPAEAWNDSVTWSSSDSKIASVDTNGNVTAKAAGTTEIVVKTSNGKTAVCTVTVKAVEPTSVTVNPTTVSLKAGETKAITAKVTPDKADQKVTYTSSDTKVASVSSNGTITANTIGTANITVKTINGKTCTCKVTVTAPDATSVAVTPSTNTINVGSTTTLKAKVSPAKADQTVTWSTSNSSVATVSANGVVTGKSAGTVTITAKTANGKSATSTVTVKAIVPSSVTLSATNKELAQGSTIKLLATVSPTNANDKSVKWTTSNSKVATVSTDGTVTAVGEGTANITATTSNGITAVCKVTVSTIEVETIALDKLSIEMEVGEIATVKATITPAEAKNAKLTWFSDDETVVTVSSSGVITAKDSGVASVAAMAPNGRVASCVVTVTNNTEDYGFAFKKSSLSTRVGGTIQLEWNELPKGVSPEFKIYDEQKHIASVDNNGLVTGLAVGDVAVLARVGKGEWTCAYVSVLPTTAERDAARKKFAEDVLYYVNIERENAGVAPLQLMDELSALAQIRTDEQAAVRNISHTRPDGSKYNTVFKGSGISRKGEGENLVMAAGYDAKACVQAWMNSPGHRANILRARFTHMGLGVEFVNGNYDGAYIATQLFIIAN